MAADGNGRAANGGGAPATNGKAYPIEDHTYDVVVVGAGGAGLRAVVGCSEAGLRTACITKVFPTRSHTVAAQGGISASLGNMHPDDWRWHRYDTVKGSDWLGDQDSIEYMVRQAPEAVYDLEHWGVPFSRTEDGRIYQRPFGGMTIEFGKSQAQRTCAAADRTGHAMLHTMYGQALRHSAEFYIEFFAIDLIMDDQGACRGVVALKLDDGTIHRFRAQTTILATGDVVSRAMTIEIREGRGVGKKKDHIYLHLDHLDPKVLHERLPGISESSRIFANVDVTREPIPIVPTAHYNMGGIPTNFHGEVLTKRNGDDNAVVPGLMALGEAACVSVHGANRLGSNSLIDLVVFGRAAALRCAEKLTPSGQQAGMPATSADKALGRLDRYRHAAGGTPTAKLRENMQLVMPNHCAVFRTGEVLEEGHNLIHKVHGGISDISVSDRSLIWNSDLVETLEFDNLIVQAVGTMDSGANRTESRGAHAREEFPDRDDKNWMEHTLAWIDQAGKTSIDYRPVHDYTMTNDVQYIPPKARGY